MFLFDGGPRSLVRVHVKCRDEKAVRLSDACRVMLRNFYVDTDIKAPFKIDI
jgi:hypothetical protein